MPESSLKRGENLDRSPVRRHLIYMCDFAGDGEAAKQSLVGRVLTVERVRHLNAKDYLYQMLKDDPAKLMWLD